MSLVDLPDDILWTIFDHVNVNEADILLGLNLLQLLLCHSRFYKAAEQRVAKHQQCLKFTSLDVNSAAPTRASSRIPFRMCSPAMALISLFQDPLRPLYVRSLHFRSPKDHFDLPRRVFVAFDDWSREVKVADFEVNAADTTTTCGAECREGKRHCFNEQVHEDTGLGLCLLLAHLPNLVSLHLFGAEEGWNPNVFQRNRYICMKWPITVIPRRKEMQRTHVPLQHLTNLSVGQFSRLRRALGAFPLFPTLRSLEVRCDHKPVVWKIWSIEVNDTYFGLVNLYQITHVTITQYAQPWEDFTGILPGFNALERMQCTSLDKMPDNLTAEHKLPVPLAAELLEDFRKTRGLDAHCYGHWHGAEDKVMVLVKAPASEQGVSQRRRSNN
jgi:hypothetical protein